MINILKNEAIRYFVDSDKKLFDAIYVNASNKIKCKIYKNNKNCTTYLYLLNNYFSSIPTNGAYDEFNPEKYGFQFSYYLMTISNYANENNDMTCPFVYLIKNNKINNIKIKIK